MLEISIGVGWNGDYKMVEFTDEASDHIQCPLQDLPEKLRSALLEIASEKIYSEEVVSSSQ